MSGVTIIWQNYGAMKLWFTMEKYGTIDKKNGTLDKTMVLNWELMNFDLQRKNMLD